MYSKQKMLTTLAMLCFASACTDAASSLNPEPALAPRFEVEAKNFNNTGVRISGSTSVYLVTGGSSSLTASTQESNRRRATTAISWTTSNAAIASVDGSGRVSAVSPGTCWVIAAASSSADSVSVTVVSSSAITVAPGSAQLATGATLQLSAPTSLPVTWSTADETIATVDNDGMVTGKAAGTVRVTATTSLGTTSGSDITVGAPTIATTISLSPASPSVTVGGTVQLTATVNPVSVVTWRSENTALADVSSAGLVTARAAGTARIYAAAAGVERYVDVTIAPSNDGGVTTPPPATAPGSLMSSPFATLPQRTVNFSYPVVTGRSLRVAAGQSVQRAVDSARYGDEIVLARGAVFDENVVLRQKTGTVGWIVIRGEGLTVQAGQRVSPSDFAGAARIVTSRTDIPAISIEGGASGWWMSGFEVTNVASAVHMYSLMSLDAEARSTAMIPTRIVVDRMWVHGSPTLEVNRCIHLGSSNSQVVDSYLSDCHIHGFDSQAILIVTSEGPLLIKNNYLEGAGENLMIGGADPTVPGVVPNDIEIVRNHFRKPMSWLAAGWTVKNLLEVKIGQRVDIRENFLENNWVSAQNGFGVLIRAANQETSNWVRTDNITFRHNVLTNSASGISLSADGGVVPLNHVAVLNNLVDRIAAPDLGVGFRLMQISDALSYVEVRNNTMLFSTQPSPNGIAVMLNGTGGQQVRLLNNVFDGGMYGVFLSGYNSGTPSFSAYGGSTFQFNGNAITVEPGKSYGAGNLLLEQRQSAFGFANWGGRDYRPGNGSPLAAWPTTGARLDDMSVANSIRSP